jgi:molybdopterin converting factor small subunit
VLAGVLYGTAKVLLKPINDPAAMRVFCGTCRKIQFKKRMKSHIQIKLFASLQELTPPFSDEYPIDAGLNIQSLLEQLKIEPERAKLIFVNGVKADLTMTLNGGERVGIFPPVGGG